MQRFLSQQKLKLYNAHLHASYRQHIFKTCVICNMFAPCMTYKTHFSLIEILDV